MDKRVKEKIHFNSLSAISVTDEAAPEIYPPHWHNAAEFTVVLTDGCKYRINETLYELKKGDILLVWPQQIHETVKIPKGSSLFIQFSSVILENNLDLVSISRFLYDCHQISAEKEPKLTSFIADKLFEIRKIYHSSDPLSETECKLCIYDILLKVGEYVLSENKKSSNLESASGSGWHYIHAACNYVVENSSENLTQAEVANHIGLSTFYFSKLFKQHMHMSFPSYLSNIRVKSAASLLLDESRSITECAFLAGFQSTTAFNKTFHDVTGYSPRDYRKLYRK
ncbi:MAG: helix-turn-helix domain-containing protein [Lachnospiraceae bacterium]|nr:helix-turn-helix domain-containing protein [Lachnospiraceae bacterium]